MESRLRSENLHRVVLATTIANYRDSETRLRFIKTFVETRRSAPINEPDPSAKLIFRNRRKAASNAGRNVIP